MVEVQLERVVHRPIEEVFARLADIDAYAEWLPKSPVFLDCRASSDGPVGVGTTYTDKTRFGVARGEVTAFEPPVRIDFVYRMRWHGLEVMEGRPAYVLERTDGGTRVRHIARGRLRGLFKVMEPFIARLARYERGRIVEALKRSLEAGQGVPVEPKAAQGTDEPRAEVR